MMIDEKRTKLCSLFVDCYGNTRTVRAQTVALKYPKGTLHPKGTWNLEINRFTGVSSIDS